MEGFTPIAKPLTLDSGALENPRRCGLQRLFSTFPGGWPGVGLLLLRAAIGVTAVVQGGLYFASPLQPSPWTFALAAISLAAGILLLAGFLTPVAGALVALASLANALSWLSPPSPGVFDKTLPALLVIIVALAIAFLGPGALSIDARLFGRREIVIPPACRPPQF